MLFTSCFSLGNCKLKIIEKSLQLSQLGDKTAVKTAPSDCMTGERAYGVRMKADTAGGDQMRGDSTNGERIIGVRTLGSAINGERAKGDNITGVRASGVKMKGFSTNGLKIIGSPTPKNEEEVVKRRISYLGRGRWDSKQVELK